LLLEEGKVKKENLYYIQGGYAQFSLEYPYLCSSKANCKKAIDGSLPTALYNKFLYLGSYDNAKNRDQLNALGITHILNMADELENPFPNETKLTYKRCGVNDTSMDDIAKHFTEALTFIDEANKVSNTNKVLVHCAMGISRSSAVAIAWLMKRNRMSFADAKSFVKLHRSSIRPNPGFEKQLQNFEKEVL